MVFHTCKNAQLTFYGDTTRMGKLYHFTGQGNVVFKGQAGTIDHNGGVAAIHSRNAGINVLAVIQMKRHRNGAVLGILFDGLGDVICTNLFILQGAIGKIGTAAHKCVGQIRTLNNGSGAEHFVNFNNSLRLCNSVDIKRALCVIVLFSGFQDGSHRYEWHFLTPP